MGFRGEALASIASIAKVTLETKTHDEPTGTKIVIEGGKTLSLDEIAFNKGTTITVENVFFNVPARYKFLKKDYTEAGYIEDVITRIALVNPDIAIKLTNNGKVIIQTTGNGNLQDVIYSIYGKDIASNVLDVEYNFDDLHISGVIGKPEIARSNRNNQLFFVNNRFIKDKKFYEDKDTVELIDRLVGGRLAILDCDGHIQLIGEFKEKEGIYYSNNTFEEDRESVKKKKEKAKEIEKVTGEAGPVAD